MMPPMRGTLLTLFVLATAPALAQVAPPVISVTAGTQEIDALWSKRDAPGVDAELDRALAVLLKAAPDDPAVLQRAAAWNFWKAEISADPDTRVRLSKVGWDQAEQALVKAPDLIAAHYWAAAACGTYGDSAGLLTAIFGGIEGTFRRHLDRVLAEPVPLTGAHLSLGRYHHKLPWPKRDVAKAADQFRAELALYPRNLRARLFWAELHLDEGTPKEALRLVDEILAATPGAYDAPEERLIQQRARAFRPRIQQALE